MWHRPSSSGFLLACRRHHLVTSSAKGSPETGARWGQACASRKNKEYQPKAFSLDATACRLEDRMQLQPLDRRFQCHVTVGVFAAQHSLPDGEGHGTSLKPNRILPAISSGAAWCDDIGCEKMQQNGSLAEVREAVHVAQEQGDAAHHRPRSLLQQHSFHGEGLEAVGGPLQLRALLAGLEEALRHMVCGKT